MSENDTETRHASETLTWCLTTRGYADEATCFDAERGITKPDHDHHDLVVDQHGKALFRVWPIGTTWRTADGYTMRLAKYDQSINDMFAADDRGEDGKAVPSRPVFDGISPNGGAFSESNWLPGPGDVIVEYVLGDTRPAPGAVFVRPNGEVWRLRSYSVDWTQEPFTGDHTLPTWSVNLPSGAGTNGDALPSDARLVWHP